MLKKIKCASANDFMFECARFGVVPSIHWREDESGVSGFIFFKLNKDEVHVFCSKDKRLLVAIWNTVRLIRCVDQLVDEVK